MNPLAIIAAVGTAIQFIKEGIEVGKDVTQLVQGALNVTKAGATQADYDALVALSDAWSEEIQRPIPPEED